MTSEQGAAAKNLSKIYSDVDKPGNEYLVASRGVMRGLIAPLLPQMGLTEEMGTPVDLFDGACGTGLFTQEIQDTIPKDVLEKSTILCGDNSEQMVAIVKRRIADEGWVNTTATVLDVRDTGLPDNSFSHVGLGLTLHLIPNPDTVLTDCKRILKPGGIFGATTFHPSSTFWLPDFRSAFASFPFDAPFPATLKMQQHADGDWTDPAWIEQHLRAQGFADVQVTLNPGTYRVKSADEFMRSFGSMLAWVTSTWWSEETIKAHPLAEVKGLMGRYLEEKYGGEGWEIQHAVICMTGRVEK
ncbi:hypothetical protein QQX98_003609 [Neonectria punicea]|uniref:Methyltransferase type 11 domain-containing protein n=1 Tax=Neonectria punicea TaxID=979145 RepID=A0ABR1HEA5_9HYPO